MTTAAWHVIVPLKDTRNGKSRFGCEPAARAALCIAMARDTIGAAAAAASVVSVLVVCERTEDAILLTVPGVESLVVPGLDMNAAIESGQRHLRTHVEPEANLAVLPADLPYLRSGEVDTALAASSRFPRAVVGDRLATGTTLLAARTGRDLLPRYGPASLARHRDGGACELSIPIWSGIRRDVDLERDLVSAPSLGDRTRALLDSKNTELEEVSG
jgi:2-phospho-L-lactate guanylyltransferase